MAMTILTAPVSVRIAGEDIEIGSIEFELSDGTKPTVTMDSDGVERACDHAVTAMTGKEGE